MIRCRRRQLTALPAQDKKVKAAVPPWLPRELEALFRRNYHPEASAGWDPDEWDECFGLRSVAPDEHPCSIMNLEVRLAKEQLPPEAEPATRDRAQANPCLVCPAVFRPLASALCRLPMQVPCSLCVPHIMCVFAQAVERFMRCLSQGVAMCLAARSSCVRVTNARKRKSSAAGDGAGSGSD